MKVSLKTLSLVLFLFTLPLCGGEYAVIANKEMKPLSLGEIRAIFLKKTPYINDFKAVPVNLGTRDAIRTSFEENILKMNLLQLKSYWTTQHYLGHRPPITMKSANTVKAFVQKVDGAIGYINIESVDENVNILYRWSD